VSQAWITHGLAYERLREKREGRRLYCRAINLRPRGEAARTRFARVGGKPGQSCDTF
jgi:Flp pilus assembly protein TadD